MKKTISLIMLILIPTALAIYGGESWSYHFDKCDKLRVNITANQTIDDGEYTIHNDCFNESKNYWICNCYDNFDFNISFKTNTINDYIFEFNYDYSKGVVEETSSGTTGGGGSGGWFRTDYTPQSKEEIETITGEVKKEVVEPIKPTADEKEEEPKETINESITEIITPPKKTKWVFMVFIMAGIVVVIIGVVIIIKLKGE